MRMAGILLFALACWCGAALPGLSQTTPGGEGAAAQTGTGAANADPEWPLASVRVGVVLDGYYSLNFNRSSSRLNQLRNFDVSSHQFSLNMAKVVLDSPAEPLGFRMDLGFGGALDLIHGAESSPHIMRHVLQAFATYRPAGAGGLTLDFGKFVTTAGAEVIETHRNWNYSRSLLFAWAIPYYHFGLRASLPLGRHFTGGLALVNGWNNVEDNNTGKTFGFFGTLAGSRISWAQSYYGGPEKSHVNRGWRHLYDTTVLLTPHSRAAMYLNFDYGKEGAAAVFREGAAAELAGGRWVGIAGAARLEVNRWFALAPRLEWFHDADGFATGTPQKLKELTLTGELRLAPGVVTRVEFRRDWSNRPFFERGAGQPLSRQQSTVLVGLLACFGMNTRGQK